MDDEAVTDSPNPQEVELCDDCGKIHGKGECGSDLLEGEQFILEFEKLPPDEHIQKLRKTIQQLRDERWQATAKSQKYRKKILVISRGLKNAHEELKKQKYSIGKLKSDAEQNHKLIATEYKNAFSRVKSIIDHVSQLEKCDGGCVYIRQNYTKLEKLNEELRAKVKELNEKLISLEVKLQEKSKEADTMQMFAKNRDITADQKVTKLQKDFVQTENELKVMKKDYLVLQRHLEDEQESTRAAIQKWEEISEENKRLHGECDKYNIEKKTSQEERQKLQNRIQDLEAELGNVKAGMKDKVDNEMLKLMNDMDKYQGSLEKRQKQDLEKEKQKTRKELEEYIKEYRDNQTKMMKTMNIQAEKYKETITDLQKQLEEATNEAEQREKLLQNQLNQYNSKFKPHASRAGTRASKRHSVTPHDDHNFLLKQKDENIANLNLEVQDLNEQIIDLKEQLEFRLKEAEKLQKVTELEALVQKQIEEREAMVISQSKLKEELAVVRQQVITLSQHNPNHYTSMGPLSIYQKRSIDKFAGFRPTESSGYDLSEMSKSAHQRYSDIKADGKFMAKSARSSKSMKSTHDTIKSNPDAPKSLKSSKSGRQDVFNVQMTGYKVSDSENPPNDTVDSFSANNAKPPIPPISMKSAKSRSSASGLEKPKPPTKSRDSSPATIPHTNKSADQYPGINRNNTQLHHKLEMQRKQNENSKPLDRNLREGLNAKDKRNDSMQKLNAWASSKIQHTNGNDDVQSRAMKPKPQVKVTKELEQLPRTRDQRSDIEVAENNIPIEKIGNVDVHDRVLKAKTQAKITRELDELPRTREHKGDIGVAEHDLPIEKIGKGKPLPEIIDKKMVAFKDRTPESRQKVEYNWKAVVPPVSKDNKTRWQPKFESINQGTVTPSDKHPLYNSNMNHPLYNQRNESVSSMSNLSTPSLRTPLNHVKPSVDIPRSNMVKAMSEKKKGNTSDAAWKMYQRLKVGRL